MKPEKLALDIANISKAVAIRLFVTRVEVVRRICEDIGENLSLGIVVV